MDNPDKGLYEKYEVRRKDGQPIKDGCIVLEWSDANGRAGIAAFSKAVRAQGYHALADDLDRKLARYIRAAE